MTVMEQVIYLADPIICTKPDGSQTTMDDPMSGVPFLNDWLRPDGCVPGPSLAGGVVDDIWGPGAWQSAVSGFVKTSSTFWMNQPSPTVADDNHVITGAAANINNSLWWISALVFMVCIAIKGAQIAWAGARAHEPMAELVQGVWDWIVASTIVAGLVSITLAATDQIASWMVDQSTGGDFAETLNKFLADPSLIAGMGNIMAIALLAFAVIFSLIQTLLFAARGGVLVVLMGVFLLSSSTTSLRRGKAGHETLVAWIVGFALFKLAAACVYSGAFWLIGTPDAKNPGWTIMQGIGLMFMAIFSLAAVVKLAWPATAPAAGNGVAGALTTAAFIAK